MKIAVRPEWTFREAVGAAWQAYHGGREHGVPNRIRVLEQWANVVGRERAQAELEATIGSFPDLDTASADLGFSIYAIKKLRRSFAKMPDVTPHAPEPASFVEFLKRLPELEGKPEISITVYVVPRLAAFLGYAESEIYFELGLSGEPHRRIDAVLAPAGPSSPHVVLELKRSTTTTRSLEEAVALTDRSRKAVGAPLGTVITPYHLAVISDGESKIYSLTQLTSREASDILLALYRPTKIDVPKPAVVEPAGAQLKELLNRVTNAKTNDEKKKALEDLAAHSFDLHQFLRCKHRNLRTKSSELDIVCEVVGTAEGFLREYGRYFFVECKNWAVPAGAKEIRDFLGKLRKSRVRLGIYFSRNGITGEQHGTDALREIHSAYDQDGTCIIVVSGQDLSTLSNLKDVLRIVDDKLDALRFDF